MSDVAGAGQTSIEALEAELRTGSIDQFPRDIGIDFFDLYELDPERRALQTKAAHLFHRGAVDANHSTLKDDFLPLVQNGVLTTDELWELNTPDLVSSKGRRPKLNRFAVPFYPWRTEQARDRYANPLLQWNPGNVTETSFSEFRQTVDPTGEGRAAMGFFAATENLVLNPEDLSGGSWVTTGSAGRVLREERFEGSQFSRNTGDGSATVGIRQFITSTPTAGGGTSRFTTAGEKVVSITLKMVDTDDVTVFLNDQTAATDRLDVDVTFSTKTVTMNVGTLLRREWYGDDIVVLTMLSTSVTAANDHLFDIRIDLATTSIEMTRIMVLDTSLEAPYTPTTRTGAAADYPFVWANQGTIQFWKRDFFQFDDAFDFSVFGSREDGTVTTDFLRFRFDGATDRHIFQATDDGANELLAAETSAHTDNSTLHRHNHYQVTWDVTNNDVSLRVNGTLQANETTTGGGIASADFTLRPLIRIGLEEDTAATALITDFHYQSVVDTSTRHYDATRPFYVVNRQLGKSTSSRQDEFGNSFSRYPFGG